MVTGFNAGMEGTFRRLGDVLSVRNGSDLAEKWTRVSPCLVGRLPIIEELVQRHLPAATAFSLFVLFVFLVLGAGPYIPSTWRFTR